MQPLRSGDIVVLIVMPARSAEKIERMLTEARLPEVPLPSGFRARSLTEAVPMMVARLDAIPREEGEAARALRAIGTRRVPSWAAPGSRSGPLAGSTRWHTAASRRGVRLDGWVPAIHKARLMDLLAEGSADWWRWRNWPPRTGWVRTRRWC